VSARGRVLVVDDHPDNRDLLARRLRRDGYEVETAENGRQALQRIMIEPVDVMLLDIMMPEMDGYQVLAQLQGDPELRHVPVIVTSAVDEIDSVARCIEMGAEDYLFKPVNAVLLRARVGASLEKKRLRDQERTLLAALAVERERSEQLLLNILPAPIAERLKRGESPIADSFAQATVLFADLADFTPLAARLTPTELIELLDALFARFDALARRHGVEKIKTIGDRYMLVGGVPVPRPDHAAAVLETARDMQAALAEFRTTTGHDLATRIGIHSGPLVAGVIGRTKLSYDLWGETVNVASRMESHGITGRIQVSEATYSLLGADHRFESRGMVEMKGLGPMPTYLLLSSAGEDAGGSDSGSP
jgi:adenylate cyclase